MNTLTQELKFQLYGDTDVEGFNLLRQARALHRAIPLIAQSMVEKTGKKIGIKRMSGPGGKTDGNTVWLMDGVLPINAKDVDRYLVYVAMKVGLVHHEIGHVNETDFDAPFPKMDPLARFVFGIVEDVRQENSHIRRFKAGRKYLDALSIASIITGLNGPVSPKDPMISVFTAYLLYTLRNRYRNEPHFLELAEGARDEMIARLGHSVVARLEAMFPRMPMLKNTLDAMDLSEDMATLLREEEKKAQQKQQQQQQQQSGNGSQEDQSGDQDTGDTQDQDAPTAADGSGQQSSDDSDDGDQDQDADHGGGQDQQDETQDGDSQPASSDSSGNGHGGDDGDIDASQIVQALKELFDGDASDAKSDLDEAVRKAINALQGEIESNTSCTTDEVDLDSVQAGLKDVTTSLHLSDGNGNLGEAVSAVARLSSRLKQKLQAQSIAKTSRSTTGSKIAPKYLTGIVKGDPRIFRKTSSGVDTDTAVFLLGDVSGSMAGPRIVVSNQAMYATALAMQRIPGIDVAVAAFPGRQMVLRFGERAKQHEKRFNLGPIGYTPLDEGVLMAHTALMHNRRPRKMLMVCTDGDPDDLAKAQASLDYAESCGIEVYGIGIQTDAVQNLFSKWTVVNEVHDLPNAMLEMLSSGLGVNLQSAA